MKKNGNRSPEMNWRTAEEQTEPAIAEQNRTELNQPGIWREVKRNQESGNKGSSVQPETLRDRDRTDSLRDRDPAQIVQDIMSRIEGTEIKRKRGARFHFRFYLTASMAAASIESLELSVRSYNSLKRAGYSTIGELAEAVAGEENVLARIRNCGKKSAEEIMARLFKYQYDQLKPERKDAYLLEVVLLNLGQPKA